MSDICVLGNFVADNTFYAEKLPTKGQTIFGSGFQVGPGGKGSNQAIAAARLNSKVSFLGKVGDDEYGKMAIELYKKDKSQEILKLAVKRMLPGGPLAKKQLTKLKIYKGDNHPHENQKPKIIDFLNMNSKNKVKI